MVKETLIQFDSPRTASACPSCGQHFSGDARFCPFDGEPLGASGDWDPSGDPLIGTVVDGRYEIQEVLGEGGMGTVYGVRHVALGRRFAVKALRRDLAQDSDLPPRFIQEAKAAAAVSHPNVVQITDFGTLPGGQPYFVMELLDGVPLSRVIREGGPVPVPRALTIARQVAHALAAAHAVGVVHRDLKPDNIQVATLGERDIVKVLDFGLAKVAGGSRFTRAGMVFGTPHYMSPEQAAGEPSDHRLDIYALGIVLYEMLTGKLPFEADTFMGVLTKHIYMVPPPPSEVLGNGLALGPLERIVMRCLEKKPEKRYATMEELLDGARPGCGRPGCTGGAVIAGPVHAAHGARRLVARAGSDGLHRDPRPRPLATDGRGRRCGGGRHRGRDPRARFRRQGQPPRHRAQRRTRGAGDDGRQAAGAGAGGFRAGKTTQSPSIDNGFGGSGPATGSASDGGPPPHDHRQGGQAHGPEAAEGRDFGGRGDRGPVGEMTAPGAEALGSL